MSEELVEKRREKVRVLRRRGIEPYAYSFRGTHACADVLRSAAELESSERRVAVRGRLVAKRGHGKACFGHIQDASGRLQVYFKYDRLGEDAYSLVKLLDVGDIIGVRGVVFRTKTGEITVAADDFELLSKSLRPLPEKWHGLKDVETRARQRYLDLIANEDARRVAVARSRLITAVREFLDGEGYLEVETPILQPMYGGAFARPFTTYHEALEQTLYLRISNELYLKRLIVGGLEKVYEIGKDFRNEGMDRLHNPEFTQVEFYEAYADYERMMDVVERLFRHVVPRVTGSTVVEYDGKTIDFAQPWKRVSMVESVSAAVGRDVSKLGEGELRRICEERELKIPERAGKGKLMETLFEELVQDSLVQPTFVVDYPRELSPLAKAKRGNPELVERFEPYVAGMEIGNAFSEQNDPEAQLAAFEKQAELRRSGDEEAQMTDLDFVTALEYGMPPTGGVGIGIDRVAMLLTGTRNIRDVLLFPHMRNADGGSSGRPRGK